MLTQYFVLTRKEILLIIPLENLGGLLTYRNRYVQFIHGINFMCNLRFSITLPRIRN